MVGRLVGQPHVILPPERMPDYGKKESEFLPLSPRSEMASAPSLFPRDATEGAYFCTQDAFTFVRGVPLLRPPLLSRDLPHVTPNA